MAGPGGIVRSGRSSVTLRVVGAALPRTGTLSLKRALERLLGGSCYHMHEVFEHLDHVPVWREALKGHLPDWHVFLAGYVATVDWPAAAFWRELSEANPEALVLLSVRDPETWWESADQTILTAARHEQPPDLQEWQELFHDLLRYRFDQTDPWTDREAALAAYRGHDAEVRSTVQPDRLVEWRTGEGWGPICRALRLPIPDEPFPHANTRAEWTKDD
jgi:hypothetical protein